ncbi:hypothetical protein BDP27DRAFT_1319194, partial [Rhodocollybia butyracea]
MDTHLRGQHHFYDNTQTFCIVHSVSTDSFCSIRSTSLLIVIPSCLFFIVFLLTDSFHPIPLHPPPLYPTNLCSPALLLFMFLFHLSSLPSFLSLPSRLSVLYKPPPHRSSLNQPTYHIRSQTPFFLIRSFSFFRSLKRGIIVCRREEEK